ncbi:hypothetical protein [Vitiosangium sp. GDMCC 1.1324]|uniref:cyanobactin maturation protease PatG family protein n=1 Tax=Vitiosangium sp. (strain GDMCC 1.1324) TaxID=2138576 RepID=UPI000D33200E|nr:hypothetical protein [Vitiosangium sp. GDMCC 1.1324]PTL83704.1 hypothetical protein DAT35_09490 [Vitiosangium sp. GDMCC 1.1324]
MTAPTSARKEPAVVQYSMLDGSFGHVYAIGQLLVTFPSRDVEKEYQQLLTPEDMSAPSEAQRLYNVLSRPENVFLAREMAWIFQIQNVATYLLEPRSSVELQALIDAIKPDDPTQTEYDVIIGAQEPFVGAGGEGSLPLVRVNRLYHFTAKAFVDSVPLPQSFSQLPNGPSKDQTVASFRALVLNIFQDMLQLADNTGDADEHRALNYVSLNYPDIYTVKWSATNPGDSLAFQGVQVRPSPLGGGRRIMEVIFTYTNTAGVTSRYYTSVDVTGQFPFLVTKLQPYFER